MMRFSIPIGLITFLIASCSAQQIESHFYSSISDCGATSPSHWYYSFVPRACYLNQTVLGVTSCEENFGCLEQHLDFLDYQDCLATAANGTLAAFGGSFELDVVDGQVTRTQYATDNCLGTSEEFPVVDNCDLNTCDGRLRRNQWFPQNTTDTSSFPIPDGPDSGDDDSDAASTAEIVGISVGVGVFGLILVCSFCGCLALVLVACLVVCVIAVILLIVAGVYARKKTQASEPRLGSPEDRPDDLELDNIDLDSDSDVDPLDE